MTSYNLHFNIIVENMHTSVQHSTTYIATYVSKQQKIICVYKQVMKDNDQSVNVNFYLIQGCVFLTWYIIITTT